MNKNFKKWDIAVSSLGYASVFLAMTSFPLFFIEFGRFLDVGLLMSYLVLALTFLLLGKYIRKKNNLSSNHMVYFLVGLPISVFAWYAIGLLYSYIEMRKYV